MLGTGYFLKITKINSRQEKPICPYRKNHTKSPICKNELMQKISCDTEAGGGGSVSEWSARRTRNPAVPGSSPALATCWICARSSRVQILGHACK